MNGYKPRRSINLEIERMIGANTLASGVSYSYF